MTLAIAAKVVFVGDHVVAVGGLGLSFGHADTCNFGFAVSNFGNIDVFDNDRIESSNFFGNENSMLESTVGELETRGDITDCINIGQVGAQTIINQNPTAIHGYTLGFVTHAFGVGSSTNGNEEQISIEGLAILESDVNALGILGRGSEFGTENEIDSALAIGALECLRARFIFIGNEVGESFNDGYFRTK